MSRYTNQPEESKRKIKSLDLKIAPFPQLDLHASVFYVFHFFYKHRINHDQSIK